MSFSFSSYVSRARAWVLPLCALAASVALPAGAVAPKAPSNVRIKTTLLIAQPEPSKPAVLDVTAREYMILWDDNSLDETGFRIEARAGNTGPFSTLTFVQANQTGEVVALDVGENFLLQFRVVAYKYNGAAVEGSVSPLAEYLSQKKTATLAAPENFRVTQESDGVLKFSWKDKSTGERRHQIYYKKASEADTAYATLGSLHLFDDREGTAATDLTEVRVQHALVPGVAYHFRLRASRLETESTAATTNALNLTSLVAPTAYPPPVISGGPTNQYIVPRVTTPTELTGTQLDSQTILLQWKDNSTNEDYYELQFRPVGSTTWYNRSLAKNSSSISVPVVPGGYMEWRVRAVPVAASTFPFDAADLTNYSNVYTNLTGTLIPPQGLTATTSGVSEAVDLVWQDSSVSESYYQIKVRPSGGADSAPWFDAQDMLANSTRATVTAYFNGTQTVNLTRDTEYDFKVQAIAINPLEPSNIAGVISDSNVAKAFARRGFTSRTYHPAKIGQPFNYEMKVSAPLERVSWTVTNLPDGLTFNDQSGIISGTPTEHGVFACPMTVTYITGSATVPLMLRIPRPDANPTVAKDIPDITVGQGAQFSVNLADKFADADTELAVRLRTNRGDVDLMLYPSLTPEAVENFMGYVETGAYNGVIVHRSVPNFIVQAGAYVPVQSPNVFSSLLKRPPSFNEPGISNLRGTIAHAKVGGNPDSATHDFFFNLKDNSTTTPGELDNQNSGFTVFARVAGDGMSVVDGIAALPIGVYKDYNTNGGTTASLDRRVILDGSRVPFEEVPMNVTGTTAPTEMDESQTVKIISARQVIPFKFEVIDTPESNEGVVRATVQSDGTLRLEGLAVGSSEVTIRARDLDNHPVDQTFNVNVVRGHKSPVITRQPVSLAVLPGAKASFTVTAIGTTLEYQWQKKDGEVWGPVPGASTKTLSFTGVQAEQTGLYRVLVGNNTTTLTSAEVRLDLRTLPAITTHPVAKVLEVGQPLVLETAATGAPPPTFIWLQSGKTVANQKLAKLNNPAVKITDGGSYVLRATNVAGKVDSNPASVIVVDKTARLMISLPAKTVVLKAQVSGPTMKYRWRMQKVGQAEPVDVPEELGRVTGTTTATLTIRNITFNDAADYTCYVEDDLNPALNATTGIWKVGITGGVPTLPATITPTAAYVGIEYDYTLPGGGSSNTTISSFAVTGLPTGLKLDAGTGRITGKPTRSGEFKLKITVKNPKGSLTRSNVEFFVFPLPESVVGTFVGQIGNSPALNGNQGGRIDMTVTDGGLITGKLSMGKDILSFTGKMDQNPGSIRTSGQATVVRKGNTPLQINLTAIGIAGYTDSGDVSGTISDGENFVFFAAYRNLYNFSKGGRPAPLGGRHHIAFYPPTSLENDVSVPQGTGYAVVFLDSNGVARVVGRLADGSTLTSSSFVGGQQQFLIYQSLYKKTGALAGRVFLQYIQPILSEEFAKGNLYRMEGEMLWTREPQALATERSYKSGFGPLALYTLGKTYVSQDYTPQLLGVPVMDRNAGLLFAKGGVEASATNPDVVAISLGKIPLIPAGITNAGGISFSADRATGLFKGSFKLYDPPATAPRVASYYGLVIPGIPARTFSDGSFFTQTDSAGVGHFSLAQLPSTEAPVTTLKNSPILSGRVNLNPVPVLISQQPQSQTVNPGASVTFSVVAAAPASTPFTYQWRKNGANINGATTASYTINPVTEAAQAKYDVVLKTIYSTVFSDQANLLVNDPVNMVTITRAPAANPVAIGSSVTFTAAARGEGPFTYKWYKNEVEIESAAGTSPTFTLNSVSTADAGTYTVRVFSAISTAGVVSDTGNEMTVSNPITQVTAVRSPNNEFINIGGNVVFTISSIGGLGPFTYQWRKDGVDILEGGTSASYNIDFVNAEDIGAYSVLVKNVLTPAGVESNAVPLNVDTAVANVNASRTPATEAVSLDTPVTFFVSAQGAGPFSFQWKKNGDDIPGANLASYAISKATAADNAGYTVLVSNPTTPAGVLSNIVLLSVISPVTSVAIGLSGNTNVFVVGDSVEFSAQPNAPGPYEYQWFKGNEAITSATDSTFVINGVGESDSGSYRVEAKNSVTSTPVSSQTITITVVPPGQP